MLTEGVTPSLHVDYKHNKIKQYHKEGRALRTETTINDSRDFTIGKRLCNLPALAQVGFSADRRLLDVERLSSDPTIGEQAFRSVADPIVVNNQRASALPFDSARTQALLSALVVFRLLPHGFRNADLQALLAPLLGLDPALMTQGRMSYDLRRLRLHGLIERIPDTHRYTVTSMIAATSNAVLVVATAALAAYALARMEFPGKRLVFGTIVATLFIPPVILVVPNYLIAGDLHWLDTLLAVIVPTAVSALGVFFLRQFFLSFPGELEEAALTTAPTASKPSGGSFYRCRSRRWWTSACSASSPTTTTSSGRCMCCSAPTRRPFQRAWRVCSRRTPCATTSSARGP